MIQKKLEFLRDFLVVLRGAWFCVLFNIIAFLAFVLAPQGQDMLVGMASDLGDGINNMVNVFALLVAVFFWSACSEFSTRILIYLTDSSGRTLPPDRVDNRKRSRKLIPLIGLFFPVCLLFISFIWSAVKVLKIGANHFYNYSAIAGGVLIISILLIIELFFLWKLYPGGLIEKISRKYKWLSWMMISRREKEWLSLLYGMLNNVRIDLPQKLKIKTNDLPRGVLLPEGTTLPGDKINFVPFSSNPTSLDKADVWVFRIKIGFYHCLIRQLITMVILSTCIIAAIGFFFPINWDIAIGSTAIICLAFGAWQIVYVFLRFADKAQQFPIRFCLLLWLVICSQINHDHPVRGLPGHSKERYAIGRYFDSTISRLNRDTTDSWYRIRDSIPLIFITAEGGALRTGAFTGLMLAHFQEKFPLFKNYLFGYSSVSGGTLGSNFFNAQLMRADGKQNDEWVFRSEAFFRSDFLSPVIAKLFFSEIVNYFYPRPLPNADRAIALEKAFEQGWFNAYGNLGKNLLQETFENTINERFPALFINTTEVETGRQSVWSNLALDEIKDFPSQDLYQLEDTNLSYSASINLSDRFPLMSPGACFLNHNDALRRHYVDGGYYENKGAATMLKVLRCLPIVNYRIPIKCYVIQFNFGGPNDIKPVRFGNEIFEMTDAIYNTRSGHGYISELELGKYVTDSLHGQFIRLDLPANIDALPMNWVLRRDAVTALNAYLQRVVDLSIPSTFLRRDFPGSSNTFGLRHLFLYDRQYVRKARSR